MQKSLGLRVKLQVHRMSRASGLDTDLGDRAAGKVRSAQKCNPCLRYVLLPMCPGRTPVVGGGGGGIRTPETLSGLTVFKTAGFNRSPTPPSRIVRWQKGLLNSPIDAVA
jgi:hypothetical protein